MSYFSKQQKKAIEAINNAINEADVLLDIVEQAEIKNHKNWDLNWACDSLIKARNLINGLNDEQYKHVRDES